ncbi:hypothetical protein M2132_000237 [Dysgonomonas sp. PH5-45]|uniref:glycosyltransferase family 2 protein n=1 Tax=unclassified Dysgonomonas TaxID=2630389 RepID=UPI0024751A2A|nr:MULTISPECIES: glycosyltransferase family A protein [unclassified Dysgonomonas]MDH6353917.1 hypothetical protein [Dysgonomonas sp. PH5-45]MDH6386819.1 hypothetical protein [Dysgonomonas sp. PH5-37]
MDGEKAKIAVVIRVYDRVEDLKYNLRVIADTWYENSYYIIVVSNGKNSGYLIDASLSKYIDKLIVLDENEGHLKGNSQLLREGVKHIPSDSDFCIILEADTWIYTDTVITKYARKLAHSGVVWASAGWYDKYYSLAVDFALIKACFVRNNPLLFDFVDYPECYIAEYLRDKNESFLLLNENMPTHIPSYLPRYPYIDDRKNKRFYVFPKSRMVTHHIEFLDRGMTRKKEYFNIVSGIDYFKETPVANKPWRLFKIKFWIALSQCFLKRSWYSHKLYRKTE